MARRKLSPEQEAWIAANAAPPASPEQIEQAATFLRAAPTAAPREPGHPTGPAAA